jgi:branched-chain amino acid transport system substrate-binding protein
MRTPKRYWGEPRERPGHPRQRQMALVCLVALGAGLGLAACGSNNSSSSSAAAPAASAAAGTSSSGSTASGSTVVVGTVGPYTGPTAGDLGNITTAYKGWSNWVNAHGGIDGHPVKVIALDDGGSASTQVANVKTLVQSDHVVALINVDGGLDSTWAAYAQQNDIPVIGGQDYTTDWITNPMFFPVTSTIDTQVGFVAATAKSAGAKSFGQLLCTEITACAQAMTSAESATKKAGLKVGYNALVSSSAPSYVSNCLAAKQSGTQAIGFGLASDVAIIHVVDTCTSQGYKPIWIIPDASFTTAMLKDPNFDKSWVPTYSFNPFLNLPQLGDFHSAMSAVGITGSSITLDDAVAWASGETLAQAAKGLSSVTRASLVSSLYTFKDETVGGLTPPLTFTKGQPKEVPCYFVSQDINGQLVSAKGLTASCLGS